MSEEKIKHERSAVLKRPLEKYPEDAWPKSDPDWGLFKPADISNWRDLHTVSELAQHLETCDTEEIDAKVLSINSRGQRKIITLDRTGFLETFKKNDFKIKLREEAFDGIGLNQSSDLEGHDFIPLLGGPFNKQQYYYDYIRGHALAFHAYHHDPIARAIATMTRDFTLGRGFRVDSENRAALALWRAFEEANDLYQLMDWLAIELCLYGEVMLWELPGNEIYINQVPSPGQTVPRGILPRIRLIDPSVIWEIVTYPEDITRPLYYQWVAPTQYQTYTGQDPKTGVRVPSLKWIFQQVPADQVCHFRVNSVSNEKRGRSDLYPVFGYLKRLRDIVTYQVLSSQKNAAWSIDTTVEGSQTDIDFYIQSMQAEGTIPEAGSEFVHTAKVKREYLAASGSGKTDEYPFQACLSMVSAGVGIPMNYFGTHLSGGSTRASALVATEPVAKKWEMRQLVYERIIKKLAANLFKKFGIEAEVEVSFPEVIVQDRSAKLQDLALCEMQEWISKERASTLAAKELGITEFEYDTEQEAIKQDPPPMPEQAPLTTPGMSNTSDTPRKPSAVTNEDRRKLSMSYGA